MSIIVPSTIEGEVLTQLLTPALTLRLYSNNVVPAHGSSAGTFTEVAGGGYAGLPLIFANWILSIVDPSLATYNANQIFNFTGPTGAPGTIYGYYVTRNSDGHLVWAEEFPLANVPFLPILGSEILILPKFTCQSLF
jgi:hypothetical protein